MILTIDFDIIMAPSIELYNDKVPKISWEELLNDPYYQLLTTDNIHYFRLTQFLLSLIKQIKKEDIIIIEDHKHVFDYVKEKSTIINIDHHHDLGYKDNHPKPELNCGNWAAELGKNNLLKKYIWIHNRNSLMPEENKEFLTYDICLEDVKNLSMRGKNIDKLILCLSEPWVPPYVRPLFFSWIELLDFYYNTKFEIQFEEMYDINCETRRRIEDSSSEIQNK